MPATADRAPDWVAAGTPEPLRGRLIAALGEDRVLTRALDLVRYASDASPYRLIPKAVVVARDAEDVRRAFAFARQEGVSATLRAGGTSLNGQGQTDGILIDVRRHFGGVEVEGDGARARVKPGTVLGRVNAFLEPYGRKLGPDPASTDIATVGGVIANNSGGMRCGVTHDSYRTVRAMKFVLPSGTVVDTEAPDAEERFAEAEPELARGLIEIRDELRADEDLCERIRTKFQIKNTMGYRLIAFLEGDTPVEILRRLIVGSEGTLAFVAEAVFDTIPRGTHTSTAFLIFEGIDEAIAPVAELMEAGAKAAELMLVLSLQAAQAFVEIPEVWKEAPWTGAGLLVEFSAEDPEELDRLEAAGLRVLEGHPLLQPADFTRDPEMTELFWTVREGLHGLIGRMRPQATTLIIEDVCVPPARIAEAAKELQGLLGEHGFLPGVAGHASAGNLHFMLTPEFSKTEDLERYEAFMEGLVALVIDKYDGSLKAEHGTGINMAHYVEREWGAKATQLMWRVKELADPDAVLSPGIVLNRDSGAHLKNLKSNPEIEEEITGCVECGFCEPVCPSRGLTTTPRQRIVLRREMERQAEGSPVAVALREQYEYDGIQTCAADGSCALVCPLGIDTGKFVKDLRAREKGRPAERAALEVAKRWAGAERAARAGLALPDGPMRGVTRALRKVVSDELVPQWPDSMPAPAPPAMPATRRDGAAAVYLPACINRIFGGSPVEALVKLSERAGAPLWIPDDAPGHCCATPWNSKGYREGAKWMADHTVEALWQWSESGELPIVMDASSCTAGLLDEARERRPDLEIVDAVAWCHDRLLPSLEVTDRLGSAAVHPTCGARHLGLAKSLAALVSAIAEEAVTPVAATCCGYAGDRGMLHPELTRAATRDEAEQLKGRRFDAYLSSNRTCEIGMSEATGARYTSVVIALEAATRP